MRKVTHYFNYNRYVISYFNTKTVRKVVNYMKKGREIDTCYS